MQATNPTCIFFLMCRMLALSNELSCRQCYHYEVLEEHALKALLNDYFRNIGLWDENCQHGGDQADNQLCDSLDTHCSWWSRLLEFRVNGTVTVPVQEYQRSCNDNEGIGLGKATRHCIQKDEEEQYKEEMKAETQAKAKESEDYEGSIEVVKYIRGKDCVCNASSECNDGDLAAIRGASSTGPSSFRSHIGLGLLLTVVTEQLRKH